MHGMTTEDELDSAAAEFIKTFNEFKKVAKKFMDMMDSMRAKEYQKAKSFSRGTQKSHEFLIQVMDESGQIGEKCFGFYFYVRKLFIHSQL